MMDEFTTEMEEAGCYVNPFVGEGRYAQYLRRWLGIVPKRQMLILNFDEWTASDEKAQVHMYIYTMCVSILYLYIMYSQSYE